MTIRWTGPSWLEVPCRRIEWPIYDRVVRIKLRNPTFFVDSDDRLIRMITAFSRLERIEAYHEASDKLLRLAADRDVDIGDGAGIQEGALTVWSGFESKKE